MGVPQKSPAQRGWVPHGVFPIWGQTPPPILWELGIKCFGMPPPLQKLEKNKKVWNFFYVLPEKKNKFPPPPSSK